MCLFWLLDYAPFVGPVKNIFQGVIAVLCGDTNSAVEKFTFAAIGGALSFFTFVLGSSLFKLRAKQGVQIVKQDVQITTTQPALNDGRPITLKKKKKRNKGRDDDDDERRNNQNPRPSKRGEHVINNNVLKVYRDIVRTFVRDVMGDHLDDMIESGRLSRQSSVARLIYHPIPDDRTASFIQDMAVFINDPRYVDTNSVPYGEAIKKLREAVVAYMRIYYSILNQYDDDLQDLEKNVRDNVEDIIARNYFVDEQALNFWLSKRGNTRQKFDKARLEVINMFQRLRCDGDDCMVITWVKELLEASPR